MQWHLLERCNLRCRHCYQESYTVPDPDFEFLNSVLNQYIETVEHFCKCSGSRIPAHLTLTGGEPFLYSDFFKLIRKVADFKNQYGKQFRWSILTNGTLLDDQIAQNLRRLGAACVQISLDGMEQTHDSIRAPGSFKQAVRGIQCLKKAGIHTMISFTVSRMNQHEFIDVAELAYRLGVDHIWSDRLIPTSHEMMEQMLSPEETVTFFQTMKAARRRIDDLYFENNRSFFQRLFSLFRKPHKTCLAMNRALQFLESKSPVYRCSAGRTLVAVLPDGTVLPCRRLPIPAGNLHDQSLLEIYKNSELFQHLRTDKPDCGECKYLHSCAGGLRCLAYAVKGNPLAGDPGCLLLSHESVG